MSSESWNGTGLRVLTTLGGGTCSKALEVFCCWTCCACSSVCVRAICYCNPFNKSASIESSFADFLELGLSPYLPLSLSSLLQVEKESSKSLLELDSYWVLLAVCFHFCFEFSWCIRVSSQLRMCAGKLPIPAALSSCWRSSMSSLICSTSKAKQVRSEIAGIRAPKNLEENCFRSFLAGPLWVCCFDKLDCTMDGYTMDVLGSILMSMASWLVISAWCGLEYAVEGRGWSCAWMHSNGSLISLGFVVCADTW